MKTNKATMDTVIKISTQNLENIKLYKEHLDRSASWFVKSDIFIFSSSSLCSLCSPSDDLILAKFYKGQRPFPPRPMTFGEGEGRGGGLSNGRFPWKKWDFCSEVKKLYRAVEIKCKR